MVRQRWRFSKLTIITFFLFPLVHSETVNEIRRDDHVPTPTDGKIPSKSPPPPKPMMYTTNPPEERHPGVINTEPLPLNAIPPKAPLVPDVFTAVVETVLPEYEKRQLWNLHIDRTEKIVVHKVNLPEIIGKRYELFYTKVVRDFRSGLEFRISSGRISSDCIVESIPSPDSPINFERQGPMSHYILDHARLLLNFDPSFVNHWGTRTIRDMPSEIWLHESMSAYVSEFAFINDSSLPITISTFTRGPNPKAIAVSNIFEDSVDGYRPFFRSQGHPDVSECLDNTPLLLRILINAPYSKLRAGKEYIVLESIRRAVAGLAGISLLRVTDLALTEHQGTTSAFWFSLRQIVNFQELSKNNNTAHSTVVFPLSDAYRILRDVITRHDVTLRVDLSSTEHMLVGIIRGSLISIPRSLHPIYSRNANAQSMSLIKATYTAGAVAGLGLSMAVLGLAVGLLLGFVLWNGSTRKRYWRTIISATPIPYGLET